MKLLPAALLKTLKLTLSVLMISPIVAVGQEMSSEHPASCEVYPTTQEFRDTPGAYFGLNGWATGDGPLALKCMNLNAHCQDLTAALSCRGLNYGSGGA